MQTEICLVNEFWGLWFECEAAAVNAGIYTDASLIQSFPPPGWFHVWTELCLNCPPACYPAVMYVQAAVTFPQSQELILSPRQIWLPAPQAPCGICSLHRPPDKWGVCFSVAERYLLEGQRGWLHWGKWALLMRFTTQLFKAPVALNVLLY